MSIFSLDLSTFLVLLYVIHAIVMAVIFYLVRRTRKPVQRGAYTWVGMCAILVPVIGLVGGLLALWIAGRMPESAALNEYEEYISYEVTNLEELRSEAKWSANLVPLTDMLAHDQVENRKHAIMTYINQDMNRQGSFLKMSMKNSDSETVHYAAATMNTLSDQFEKMLKAEEAGLDGKDEEAVKNLSAIYRRYVESELLSAFQKEKLIEKWRKLLLVSEKRFTPSVWLYETIGDTYRFEEKWVKAEHYYNKLVHHFPAVFTGYERLIHLYYDQNRWDDLRLLIRSAGEQVDLSELTDEQQFTLDLLGGSDITCKSSSVEPLSLS